MRDLIMKLRIRWRRPRAKGLARRRPRVSPQLLYTSVVTVLALGFAFAAWSIYRTVDLTLTSSETVLRLRQDVAQETFRVEDFTRALRHFEAKQRQNEPDRWDSLPNAFQQGE